MKRLTRLSIVGVVFLALAGQIRVALAAESDGEEAAVRALLATYTKAFNARDEKALAECWAPEADYVDAQGTVTRGRDEILKTYAEFFARYQGVTLAFDITSIRLLTEKVAIVDAAVQMTPAHWKAPGQHRTTLVLGKRDNRWLIDSARGAVTQTFSPYEHLRDLEWMVGEWADTKSGPESVSVQSSCDWTVNRSFLIRKFDAKIQDRVTVSGTELIGWDARDKRIRSWVFDSTGGFHQGVWVRDGDHWIVTTTGVLADGSTVSAVNVFSRIDQDTFSFRSEKRRTNGEKQPDIASVEIKRVSPGPAPSSEEKPEAPTEKKATLPRPARLPSGSP